MTLRRPALLARVAGAAAVGIAGGLLGAAAYTTSRLNGQVPPHYTDTYTFTPFELGVDFEEVRFASSDGLTLAGWWLPQPKSSSVVVCCAGHRGVRADMLGIGSGLWRAGNTVLIFDWRGRGQSEAALHTLAAHQTRDLDGAIDYALARAPGARLGVVGFSMGAAVALLVAARRPQVRAVVADSSFTSIADLVSHAVGQRHLPGWAVTPLANLLTTARYGYRFGDVRPIDSVAAISPRPLLLIHGSADTMIPVAHGHRLFARAAEPKELWELAGLEHCGAYFADRATYIARVAAFFDQHVR